MTWMEPALVGVRVNVDPLTVALKIVIFAWSISSVPKSGDIATSTGSWSVSAATPATYNLTSGPCSPGCRSCFPGPSLCCRTHGHWGPWGRFRPWRRWRCRSPRNSPWPPWREERTGRLPAPLCRVYKYQLKLCSQSSPFVMLPADRNIGSSTFTIKEGIGEKCCVLCGSARRKSLAYALVVHEPVGQR